MLRRFSALSSSFVLRFVALAGVLALLWSVPALRPSTARALQPATDTVFFNCGGNPTAYPLAPGAAINVGGNTCVILCTEQGGDDELSAVQPLICPGPPAHITLLAPSAAGCGSMLSVSASVSDAANQAEANGYPVTFATSLGSISSPQGTAGGVATASLTIPPQTPGTANLTVTSGPISVKQSISVTC